MNSIKQLFENYTVTKRPTSERAYLIQAIADAIGVPFKNVLRETYHLKGSGGNHVLQIILDDTLRSSEKIEWRAKKCRELIDKSR